MPALVLKNHDYKALVIAPIYDKLEKIEKILKLSTSYDRTILNGNLCYPYDNIKEVESRFEFASSKLFHNKNVLYNVGHHDLIFAQAHPEEKFSKWINTMPNVIMLEFNNQTSTIITNGGVTPKMNKKTLLNDIETTFVSKIDNESWHKKYYGNYGYIVSNNPLTLEAPQFHAFSMHMGNKYENGAEIYAQEVFPLGLKQTILL